MNKLFIVLLAVCLFSVVSAHAFVKRDASTTDDLTAKLNTVKDKITELGSDVGKKLSETVNPEVIKKNINDLIDLATKTLDNFKPAPGAVAATEDAKPAA